MLSIENQSQGTYGIFEISNEEFAHYLKRSTILGMERIMVAEDNDAMCESYLMIDPAGRFFDNSTGAYKYSESICDAGIPVALAGINFDYEKYL